MIFNGYALPVFIQKSHHEKCILSDHLLSVEYGNIDVSVFVFYIINIELIQVLTNTNQSTARIIFSLQLLFSKSKMNVGDWYILLVVIFSAKCSEATDRQCHNETGRCYWLGTGSKTWDAARTACQSEGGDLAVMEIEELHDFISNLFSSGWVPASIFEIQNREQYKLL